MVIIYYYYFFLIIKYIKADLDKWERANVADALERCDFDQGTHVVEQGFFYINKYLFKIFIINNFRTTWR